MAVMYLGVGGEAKKVKKFYIGVGGQAKKVKRGYIGVGGQAKLFYKSTVVPDEYQQVEYIYNDKGKNYINTNVIADNNTKVSIDFMVIELNQNVGYTPTIHFLAASGGSGKQYRISGKLNGSSSSYQTGDRISLNSYFGSSNIELAYELQLNTYYKVENNFNGEFRLNNTLISTASDTFNVGEGIPLYLFGNNANGTDQYLRNVKARVYNLSIWQNNILIRDMIPCYRKSDEKAGVYDIINNVFYTGYNDGSNYDFTVGPNVD